MIDASVKTQAMRTDRPYSYELYWRPEAERDARERRHWPLVALLVALALASLALAILFPDLFALPLERF